MWHTIFIAAHATTGGLALLAGCVTIVRRTLFGTYFWSLIAMEVFLMLAIAAEWTTLDLAAQMLFGAFAVLGLVMVWRANEARRGCDYFDHIGFTLVALFDAFVVILVLNLGAPVWLVVSSGVGIAVAGHYVLVAARRVLVREPTLDGARSPRHA